MKTYFLMIGASVVLTLGVICVVSYRMSLPDSTAQPKAAHQPQKQAVAKKLIPETPAPAPASGSVSTTPSVSKKSAVQNKSPISNRQIKSPFERFNDNRIAKVTQMPGQTKNQQNLQKTASNAETGTNSADVRDANIKVWTQEQDIGNFSSIAGNTAFAVPPGTQVRIIGMPLAGIPRPGRGQTNTVQAAEKPVNVGLSSRLPDEFFKQPPFQPRHLDGPVNLVKSDTPKPTSPQYQKMQELLDTMPPKYHDLLGVVEGRIPPDANGSSSSPQTGR